MDLLLINPASHNVVYQSLAANLAAIEPPVWAGLMASFVRNKGFSVAILDAEALHLSVNEVTGQVQYLKPRLAAIVVYGHQPSASTQLMPACSQVCTAIKQLSPNQPVIMLGGHVAALPERTLREEQADFVSGGEGLVTLVELLTTLQAGATDYGKVSDLYHRQDGHIVAPVRKAGLIQDLDRQMPGIAWDLLPMDRYRAHNWHCFGNANTNGRLVRSPYAALYTTLGCPFRCSFCCIQAPFKSGEAALGRQVGGHSYRFWSPRRVVDELEFLSQNYGIQNVKFADEMFVLTSPHVEAICDLIAERKLDLNIWAYARVDTVKDRMLPKLKAAGVNGLAFGIEAANAKVRDDVQKGFDQADIATTLRKVADHGIYIIGNYIFGLPEDNQETMTETLDLALELNCEFANFYCAMAYPGSELYARALTQEWQLPKSWGGYSQHSFDTLPLPTKYLSGGEVLRFRDRAFRTYFCSPAYLDKVERKFGAHALEHIREMTRITLPRKYAV